MAKRESNIELFRIVATFMILIVHQNGWMLRDFGGVDSWWDGGASYAMVRTFVQALTCVGVDCFVLISGYFSIRPKLRSVVNLFTLLAFFYLGCYAFDVFVLGNGGIRIKQILYNVFAFSRESWFIQCYLFLILLSPVLNKFVESVTERSLLIYILAFGACAFYFGCVKDSKYFYFNGGYSVTTLVLLYLVGRYLGLYGEKNMRKWASFKIVLVWMGCTLLMMLGYLYIPNRSLLWCYCSPIQIISSSCLLLLFVRLRFQNSFVNWTGCSCLAVFILHTCDPVFSWLVQRNSIVFHAKSLPVWGMAVVADSILIFVLAILLDKVRIFMVRPVLRLCDKIKIK